MADKVTRSMQTTMKRKRSKMAGILQQLESWAQYKTLPGQQPAAVSITESQLEEWLVSGQIPIAMSTSVQLGRELFMIRHETLRCHEERQYLQLEVLRYKAWIDYKLETAKGSLMKVSCSPDDVRRWSKHACMKTIVCGIADHCEVLGSHLWTSRRIADLIAWKGTIDTLYKEVSQVQV